MDGGEFFQPESMYAIMARRFRIWYLLMLFLVNRCVFYPSALLQVLTLFPCCLSIRVFVMISWLQYFAQIFFFFSLHLVVGMSLRHLPLHVGNFFFIVLKCPIFFCIVLSCLDIFLIFLLSPIFLAYFLELYCYFYLSCFFLLVSTCSMIFPLFYYVCFTL